jgi:hypothetical protein
LWGAHCPLIDEMPTIRTWGGGLDPFDQAHLEINFNIVLIDLHGFILNSKLETKIRLNIYFSID